MRKVIFSDFNKLKSNSSNTISFYVNNKKQIKTFSDFHFDVINCSSQLRFLCSVKNNQNIAIIGPTSYTWMVIDWACIIGGFRSIAIPEFLTVEKVKQLMIDTDTEIVLIDKNMRNHFLNLKATFYDPASICFYNENLETLKQNTIIPIEENKIVENYGIGFTSGTSEEIKKLSLSFFTIEPQSIFQRVKSVLNSIPLLFSIWVRKNNKLIIYMPFSHVQQRFFARLALSRGIDIILSDPKNCIKHIIVDKPNIMISVPVIYQVMAKRIQHKISQFGQDKQRLFSIFNSLGINGLSNRNPIKILFSYFLFQDIRKIYGGRADYFVTGSAAIDLNTLKIFYSIGIKILEGYGQSENGFISMNTHSKFKLGSVGKPNSDVKIASDNEILFKYDEKYMCGNKHIMTINEDGFIQTGDLGYLDKSGYLFITGRIDDVIVLGNGKKIFPSNVEQQINNHDLVLHSIVYSTDNISISAIISCHSSLNVENTIMEYIRSINQSNPAYEQIDVLIFINEIFTPENGFMTSSLKLRRKAILEKYSHYSQRKVA